VPEVRAQHIQQEQVQQLLQAEGGAQRGGSGMQQGEFCLMDSFHLRSSVTLFLALFGSSSIRYRTPAFSPSLSSPRLHNYVTIHVITVIECYKDRKIRRVWRIKLRAKFRREEMLIT